MIADADLCGHNALFEKVSRRDFFLIGRRGFFCPVIHIRNPLALLLAVVKELVGQRHEHIFAFALPLIWYIIGQHSFIIYNHIGRRYIRILKMALVGNIHQINGKIPKRIGKALML